MTNEKPTAEKVCKEFEDLAPRRRLSPTARDVYSHLFRPSRLEGTRRLAFSIPWLARGAGLTHNPVRWSVRRLIARGVLRLVERSKEGHVVEVRLPEEFPVACPAPIPTRPLIPTRNDTFEELDFLKHRDRRRAIHVRERGRCFYCRRRLTSQMRCLDHVVPRVDVEDNSYRNLVSCCHESNSLKRAPPPPDFLPCLHPEPPFPPTALA